jgi:chemotaxis receptor (MCP) glutamine deamidase CheD
MQNKAECIAFANHKGGSGKTTSCLSIAGERCRRTIVAKMTGGAQMFTSSDNSGPGTGNQNISSIRRILYRERIPLSGEDVGGKYGRNVEYYLDSGKVIVKTARRKEGVAL